MESAGAAVEVDALCPARACGRGSISGYTAVERCGGSRICADRPICREGDIALDRLAMAAT